ncbi:MULTISPECIES: alanine racemase C-terminal domain-containing protein [Microbacterium]|uniref:alanine racemase C-terminal domain-containing protein n=1 Tax=Microbacterium TaxID=33882 RepID=UPI00217E6EFA|nr:MULTISPECIES: alanine racemase C-terminal domain-containing protein [Microbacterium]UWF76489.1 hypothetical protein JSY13_06145 [Microbacterium neungamense]WCM54640.1 hypothetical protein JRG78_06175 [Microbacterium sp. EF45047]
MSGSRSLPRAEISARAVREAAEAAVAAGGVVADLRGDAYGHGVAETARVVTDAGVRAVLVDDARTVESLAASGIRAVTDGEADIAPEALYGLPGAEDSRTPAMRLAGRVLSVKRMLAGEAVSYGYTHRATVDTTTALVTGGYAQGVVRALGNHARVEIDGVLRPIIGRVAMDVCVVDLEGAHAEEGTDVIYFGGTGPARDALADWARITGLRPTELVAVAGAKAVREWRA